MIGCRVLALLRQRSSIRTLGNVAAVLAFAAGVTAQRRPSQDIVLRTEKDQRNERSSVLCDWQRRPMEEAKAKGISSVGTD